MATTGGNVCVDRTSCLVIDLSSFSGIWRLPDQPLAGMASERREQQGRFANGWKALTTKNCLAANVET